MKRSTDIAHSHRRRLLVKIARRTAVVAGCLLALLVLAVAAIMLYLTPERVTRLFNEHCGDYVEADVHAARVDYRFWSTFPRLCVEVDSLCIVSHSLRGITPAERDSLPLNADSLLSLRKLRGSVNVPMLFAGRVRLNDVRVSALKVNLVDVNETVNNYSIIPSDSKLQMKVPQISADRVLLDDTPMVTYFSAQKNLNTMVRIAEAEVKEKSRHSNDYNLSLMATADAVYDGIHLCRRFPFTLNGLIALDFKPFAFAMRDMRIGLGNITGNISMGMKFDEDATRINDFRTEISTTDIMKLLEYLPAEYLPDLTGLRANLHTGLSVRFTQPFNFKTDSLPSFEARLTVPQSTLSYTLDNGTHFDIDRLTLIASVDFDGRHPNHSRCDIERFNAVGDGLSVLMSGRIDSIFSHPDLSGAIDVKARLPKLAQVILPLAKLKPQGDVMLQSEFEIPLYDMQAVQNVEIPVRGVSRISDLALTFGDGTTLNTRDVNLRFGKEGAAHLIATGSVGDVSVGLHQGTVINVPDVTITASDFTASSVSIDALVPKAVCIGKGAVPQAGATKIATRLTYDGKHLNMDGTARSAKAFERNRINADAYIDNITFAGRNLTGDIALDFAVGSLRVKRGSDMLKATKLTAAGKTLDTWHLDVGGLTAGIAREGGKSTSASLKGAQIDIDKSKGDLLIDSKLRSGVVNSEVYPDPIHIYRLDFSYSPMTSLLRSLRVESGLTGVDITGSLDTEQRDGKDFYVVNTDVDFDTLHFNQIAQALKRGSIDFERKDTTVKAPQSYHPFIVPSNVDLRIHATADALVYTNLWMSNLMANISMLPGQLSLDTLSLTANFGKADASIRYDCKDTDHLGASVNFTVDDFNLTQFFISYPDVLAAMPMMNNLHGTFHANGSVSTAIFPTMYLNTASTVADLNVHGYNLFIHQTPFIRSLARMALIFRKDDIMIPDVSAHVRIFDRLVNVDPFDINIGKYQLNMAGCNDFAGNMYYHLGVMHNPWLNFRFGINIKGQFPHPHLRFSGPSYSVENAEKIDHVRMSHLINLVEEFGKAGRLLVNHAAESEILDHDPYKKESQAVDETH